MVNDRLSRLQMGMVEHAIDGLLVARPENRRYISGFTGTAGTLLITPTHAWFIADFRYVSQATAQCVGFDVVAQGDSLLQTLEGLLRQGNVKSLGFEQDFLTYADVASYRQLEARIEGFHLMPVGPLLESDRMCKDDLEVRCIERAAKIADAAFDYVLGVLRPGLREVDVALEMETFMRRQGASGAAFETIVASGLRGALPHGVASDKPLEYGDLVTLDFGAVIDGYHSDLTRTVAIGHPTAEQRRIYQIVLDAQLRAIDAVEAGRSGRDLDAVARDFLTAQGLGPAFGHSLGHGIGLEIHEGPKLSKTSSDVLAPGMVVTIEPGVYVTEWGGVRIEDDLLVLERGARLLTHSPKQELISV